MKISCPSCQSKYTIADDKVQGRSVKVRCRKCGETIHVTSGGAEESASTPPGAPDEASGAAFSVLVAEGDQRDMSLADLVSAYNSGVVTADTFVWGEGQADWMPLGQVAAIVEAINAASAAVDAAREAAPAPEPAPAPQPEPAPAPAAAPALFGAEPVAPPQPAAAVQGNRRRDVDLFGAAKHEEEVATSAPALGAVVQPQMPAGTRDESSVLFSLSALTSATASRPSNPTGGGEATKDDSGLIDLKALAAKADKPKTDAPVMMGGLLDAAPLLGTPLLDSPTAAAAEPVETKKSKAPMFIGIGIGFAGLAIAAALFVVMRSGPTPAAAPSAAVTPPATASEVAAAPTTTDSGGAAPPSTGAPSASAAAPTKGGKWTGGKTTKKDTGTSAATPTAPATTAVKPKASPCGCAPTDLMCNMNCQVKKK